MRVLLLQRTIDPPGGGNAVAAWMLHALAPRHEVITITERPWDAARVNAYYGTAIDPARVRQTYPSWPWATVTRLPGRLDRLRLAVLQRAARRQRAIDLAITADNYAAFTRPGIQYLHFPLPLRPEPPGPRAPVHAYYRVCDAISGLDQARAAANLTLVNSRWTAARVDPSIAPRTSVLYPPVPDPGLGRPWHTRGNLCLCVGRFHGSKRLHLAIEILAEVRRTVPDMRLVFVGSAVDADYAARLRRWVAPHASWIAIEEDLPQPALHALMRRARYGLHLMEDEHFGIAPAEMARAGCLVCVHESGGIVEVVGSREALRWRTPEDAVARILALAADPVGAEALSAALSAHAARFSCERFVADFLEIVEHAAPGPKAAAAAERPPTRPPGGGPNRRSEDPG